MGFLGKARKMMGQSGAKQPPKPQYFQVSCVEGHVIRGERTEGYQALRCPHCGDGVFVLPRSPLPMPPAPSSSRPKRRAAAESFEAHEERPIEFADAPPQEDLDEIQWLEPEGDQAPPRARPRTASASAEPILEAVAAEAEDAAHRPQPRVRPARPRQAANVVPVAASRATPGRIAVPVRSRPRIPIGWLSLGVLILVTATIGYRLWRQRLQNLPHEAEVNRVEGIAALEKGQFDEARKMLGQSAAAYRTLGATDEAATTAIQLADEAAILATLDRDTLKEIVEEVARMGDPDGIARFDSIHKGRSILIDSEVASTTGGVVDLRYRILVGRGPTPAKQGMLDLSGFTLFEGATMPKVGARALFGARLGSIRLEGGLWKIAPDPESGVLMTNEKALQAAAMGPAGSLGIAP